MQSAEIVDPAPSFVAPEVEVGNDALMNSSSASASTSALPTPAPPPLSKNAQKKLARQQALEAQKPARRARERAIKKVKLAEKRKAVELGEIEKPVTKRAQIGAANAKKEPFGARVVLDLGFDELMNDREIKSMSSQVGYCYSANRLSTRPVQVLISSFTGQLRERIETKQATFTSWKGIEWWEESYDNLWSEDPSELISIGARNGHAKSRCAKDDIIYLSGDSPNVLEEFEEGKTYILGGLVDKNRHKSICFDKAVKQGIRHAKLPIAEYMPDMPTRKILTVNQVFSIIVKWTEVRDWKAALTAVMPTRKLATETRKERRAKGGEAADGEEDEDEGGEEGESEDPADGSAVGEGKDGGDGKEAESKEVSPGATPEVYEAVDDEP